MLSPIVISAIIPHPVLKNGITIGESIKAMDI
jgi:hypothetical protein